MGKTIIQTIGPLYGEIENGTVFGRPNGSVFVPAQNTIKISLIETYRYLTKQDSGSYMVTNSSGNPSANLARQINVVAESQDIANYMQLQVSADNFENILSARTFSAGSFNQTAYIVGDTADAPDIVQGDKYQIRAVLYSASGVAVATSDSIELTGVVVS